MSILESFGKIIGVDMVNKSEYVHHSQHKKALDLCDEFQDLVKSLQMRNSKLADVIYKLEHPESYYEITLEDNVVFEVSTNGNYRIDEHGLVFYDRRDGKLLFATTQPFYSIELIKVEKEHND